MHGPFLAVFALLIATLIPTRGQASGSGKPDAPNGSFVEVENGKIYYEECGNAPTTVVLIHDGIAHSVVWDGVWPLFCQNFRTIRYDRRGYGKSPAATTWYYETDDLAALLRHLKVPRAVLVGSSHGGELSIDFALCHPDMVEPLVLVGAVVSGFPYSDHFLNRGMQNSKPFQQNDVKNGIANWAKDRYLLAPGHETAQKKLLDILTASP
jgi:pimeloyl-ACP methyl ester carboxylesterase